MTTHDELGERPEGLEFLTPLAPDAVRSERVRLRCRVEFERRARRASRTTTVVGLAERLVVAALLGAVSLYGAALAGNVLRVERAFRLW